MSVIYVGHRGGRKAGFVENTKEAFLDGAMNGCRALECDVRITKDNVLVISHDFTLERLTKLSDYPTNININDSSYDEIKNILLVQENKHGLSYGYICLFETYLKICKEYNMIPVIELKQTNNICVDIDNSEKNNFCNLKLIIDMVQKYLLLDKAVFISFMKPCLVYLRSKYPNVKIQLLSNDLNNFTLEELEKEKFDLDIQYLLCTKELVDKCHDKGIKVNIWTLNDEQLLKNYLDMGVDYITSDYIYHNIDEKN